MQASSRANGAHHRHAHLQELQTRHRGDKKIAPPPVGHVVCCADDRDVILNYMIKTRVAHVLLRGSHVGCAGSLDVIPAGMIGVHRYGMDHIEGPIQNRPPLRTH